MAGGAGLPESVRDSRWEAEFQPNSSYPNKTINTQSSGRRLLREEVWTREKRLGHGGFGIVWLERADASSSVLPSVRAVKELKLGEEDRRKGEYIRELEALIKFSQKKFVEYFVEFYSWFETEDTLFIATEYCEHGDLKHYITKHGRLPENQVQKITGQVLQGLIFMHESNFAHRDLKPANILIQRKPPEYDWHIKICDMGLTKRIENDITSTTVKGTPRFMPPERIPWLAPLLGTNPRKVDPFLCDMWCLGEVIFFMLTCETTFDDSRKLRSYVNKEIWFPREPLETVGTSYLAVEFIVSLMAVQPNERLSASQADNHAWMTTLLDGPELLVQNLNTTHGQTQMAQDRTSVAGSSSEFVEVINKRSITIEKAVGGVAHIPKLRAPSSPAPNIQKPRLSPMTSTTPRPLSIPSPQSQKYSDPILPTVALSSQETRASGEWTVTGRGFKPSPQDYNQAKPTLPSGVRSIPSSPFTPPRDNNRSALPTDLTPPNEVHVIKAQNLPPGWMAKWDPSRNKYSYVHSSTGIQVPDIPNGTAPLSNLPPEIYNAYKDAANTANGMVASSSSSNFTSAPRKGTYRLDNQEAYPVYNPQQYSKPSHLSSPPSSGHSSAFYDSDRANRRRIYKVPSTIPRDNSNIIAAHIPLATSWTYSSSDPLPPRGMTWIANEIGDDEIGLTWEARRKRGFQLTKKEFEEDVRPVVPRLSTAGKTGHSYQPARSSIESGTSTAQSSIVAQSEESETTDEKPLRLYVGNLDFAFNQRDMHELFSSFGPISDAIVVHDRETGLHRGFGFITFKRTQDAKRAITRLHNQTFRGRCLRVEIAW